MTLPPIDRRFLLAGAGALTFAAAGGGAALANTRGERKFVLVILRGGLDGLAAFAPYADPHYRPARGRLALPAPDEASGLLPLSDGFGLHPRLAFLHETWRAGELAILHAAATPYRERSHFDGQDVLESGGAKVYGLDDGWLNRAIALLPPDPHHAGIAIGGTIPLVLRGAAPASSWAPSVAPSPADDTLTRLMDLYAGDSLLGPSLARAIDTAEIVDDMGMAGQRGQRGQRGGLAAYAALMTPAARLLAAPDGPAAAVVSLDGWDTHAQQGGLEGGLAFRLAALDAALKALKDGLGAHWGKTVVVVATEFGRTVAENGTGGTDHGTAGAAFALGGAVRGGRFLGEWPTLAPGKLYQGRDLMPVNDVRSLFASVLEQHWGLNPAALRSRAFDGANALARFDRLIA